MAKRKSYRPQFAYPIQPGDEPFEYFFDQTNVPALSFLVTDTPTGDIPLTLEPDAKFMLRGIQVGNQDILPYPIGMRFKDPYGNYLSSDFVPQQFYSGFTGPGEFAGGEPSASEPEIECPAGSSLMVNLTKLPDPPMLIDSTDIISDTTAGGAFRSGVNESVGGDYGPFEWNGHLYACYVGNPQGGNLNTPQQIYFFKSTDLSGSAWNALPPLPLTFANAALKSGLAQSGSRLYFVYIENANPFTQQLGAFDMATDSLVVDVPTPLAPASVNSVVCACPDGTIAVVEGQTITGGGHTSFFQFGRWSPVSGWVAGPVVLEDNTGKSQPNVTGLCSDASSNVYFYYQYGGTPEMRVQPISNLNVPGTSALVTNDSDQFTASLNFYAGPCCLVFGGVLYVVYYDNITTSSHGGQFFETADAFVMSSPLSPLSFTQAAQIEYVLNTTVIDQAQLPAALQLVTNGATLFVFWQNGVVNTDSLPSGNEQTVNQFFAAPMANWAPVPPTSTYEYDYLAFPPPAFTHPSPETFIRGRVSTHLLSNGRFGTLASFAGDTSENTNVPTFTGFIVPNVQANVQITFRGVKRFTVPPACSPLPVGQS